MAAVAPSTLEREDPLPRERPRVFIVYEGHDLNFVEELAAKLQESRVTVLMAIATLLTADQDWREGLSNALRNTDAVLVVLSAASSGVPALMAESGAALGMFEEQGRPLVIPILIDNTPIPAPLAKVQSICEPRSNVTGIVEQVIGSIGVLAGRIKAREEHKLQVERHLDAFIGPVLDELRVRERNFTKIAYRWYAVVIVVLGLAFALAMYRAVQSVIDPKPEWKEIVQITVASLIVIALVGAIARFAFVLGRSFMVESLRNSNRFHAISFGQFFLRAFGDSAQWEQIKDAFQFWNIDTGSSFPTQKPDDIDPQILQTAIAVANAIGGKMKTAESPRAVE